MNGCYHQLNIHIHTSTDKDDVDLFLASKSRDGKVIVEITTVHLARGALKIEVRSDLARGDPLPSKSSAAKLDQCPRPRRAGLGRSAGTPPSPATKANRFRFPLS
jgi:hypothetical protein